MLPSFFLLFVLLAMQNTRIKKKEQKEKLYYVHIEIDKTYNMKK